MRLATAAGERRRASECERPVAPAACDAVVGVAIQVLVYGLGVKEIRIHTNTERRVVSIAKFQEAVYVLHGFEKRTRRTPKDAIDLAKTRLRELLVARRKARSHRPRGENDPQ